MPCGKTVCNHCILLMETTSLVKDSNELKCIMCNDFHKRPTNGSFPLNEILLGLMNEKPKEVYRSEEVENLKLNLNKLEALSNTFQFNLNNSEAKIKEHCIELRRLSQLSTEQKKTELDQFNDDFIKQINQYESNCIHNLKDKQYKQFDLSIKEIIMFNKEKRNYLKTYNINDKQIIDANKMATSFISKVNDQITNLDCYIFNSNKMEFITNKDKLDNKIVGSINFEKLISKLKVHKINFENLQLETRQFFFDFLSNSENILVYKDGNNHKWMIAKLDLFSLSPKFNKNMNLNDIDNNKYNNLKVNDFAKSYTNDINSNINKYTPLSSTSIKQNNFTLPQHILDLIKQKNKHKSELARTGSPLEKKLMYNLKDIINKEIIENKQKEMINFLEKLDKTPVSTKPFWKRINQTRKKNFLYLIKE